MEVKSPFFKYARVSIVPSSETHDSIVYVEPVSSTLSFDQKDTDRYSYSKNSFRQLQDELFASINVTTKDVDPNSLGNIFITKSADLPRYKIRDIKDKHNIKIVRDPLKADTIIISKDEFVDSVKCSYGAYYFERSNVMEILTAFISRPERHTQYANGRLFRTTDREKNMLALQNTIKKIEAIDSSIEYLCLDYGSKSRLEDMANGITLKFKSNPFYIEQSDLQNLLSYSSKKVVTDASLQSFLGSKPLEHSDFIFIDQLLSSTDPGNIELGLTLMANCNFEQSQHYLMLLLNDHYSKYYSMNYCKTVSFKSLLSFMNYNRYTADFTYDKILDKADSLGLMTEELKEYVKGRFLDEAKHIFNRYKWIKVLGVNVEKPSNDTN